MNSRRIVLSGLWTLFTLLLCSASLYAADGDKPFAEQRVVLQISDDDPVKQTLVLNVANNLIKYYGADKADIEVVAFGPGLRLMFADNINAKRVEALANNSGVRFAACKNTLAAMTKALGHAPELNAHSTLVDAGIVRILELTAQGYTLVRP